MTFIKSLLIATSFFVTAFQTSATTETVANTESATTSYTELMNTIKNEVDYPEFAQENWVDPIQEIIVQVQFRVNDNNTIELINVSGSNERVNEYVYGELDGITASETPLVKNVTFVTTLRFIK
jgi:hypothetical protein